jgi:predicted PurR-regulated permease PerM
MLDAPAQYRELLDYTARTVLELRQKLSPEIAEYLPEGAADLQRLVARSLSTQAGALAQAGRTWLNALLFIYVGLIVGALAAVRPEPAAMRPLTAALHQRVTLFGEAFGQIVAAQLRISAFNTALTAIFLLFVLPLWTRPLPYTGALIALTFFAGLVPIVGNLVCNALITVMGLSISPLVGLACLAFLVLIHKAEYIINAQVVGHRTQMSVWELLAAMFVAEAIFGPAGLVAAPLYYAYTKKELRVAGLI